MKEIYLLLGSNIGDRSTQLHRAVSALDHPNLKIRAASKIYETAAWGKTDQASFLNQVIECECNFSPEELLLHCQNVEKSLGRERFELWGPRTIDIDILYFGNESHNTKSLIIPHPGIALRGFTLAPLAEIAPKFKHPLLGLTNEQLLEICPDQLEVLPYSPPVES